MNVTFNKIYSNTYQIISDKLSQLSPLQKKVALFVLAYLSLATLGYLIYSCYAFQGRRKIEEEMTEEETKVKEISSPVISLKEECEEKKLAEKVKEIETTKGDDSVDAVVREHMEEIEKSGEEEKPFDIEKDVLKDVSVDLPLNPLDLEYLPLKTLEIEKCETLELDALKHLPTLTPLKLDFGMDVDKIVEALPPLKPLTIEQCDLSDIDLEPLVPSLNPKLKTLDAKIRLPTLREGLNQFKLDNNKTEARLQQDKEVPKGFDISKYSAYISIDAYLGFGEDVCVRLLPSGREIIYISDDLYGLDYCCVSDFSFFSGGKKYSGEILATFEDLKKGDAQPVRFLKDNIAKYLQEALEKHNASGLTSLGIYDAIINCYEELNKDIPPSTEGISGSFSLILDDHIWVVNLGRNRTLLIKDGKTTKASVDHSHYSHSVFALFGNSLKGKSFPKITCYPLQDFQGGYLVAASDGLFAHASSDEIGQAIQSLIDQRVSEKEIVKTLLGCPAMKDGNVLWTQL